MKRYIVTRYERISVMMTVEADSEEEAIDKAKAGDYIHVDTEPGPRVYRPKWEARKE